MERLFVAVAAGHTVADPVDLVGLALAAAVRIAVVLVVGHTAAADHRLAVGRTEVAAHTVAVGHIGAAVAAALVLG
ncbi:hypothetical protein ACTHQ2_22505 [Bacillus subtilis]|uniref:hypothetical protein n=1 Tax=Bacillus subtilis TaxID=1423 RepID=UPI003F7B5445